MEMETGNWRLETEDKRQETRGERSETRDYVIIDYTDTVSP